MRPTRRVIAVLLLPAITAIGCSKHDAASRTPAEPKALPQAKLVATGGTVVPKAVLDDEAGVISKKLPTSTSFADGKAAFADKKYADAAAIFEGYTSQRPRNVWGHYMLGLSAWKNGDLAKAEGAFETALGIEPNHVKSLVNLSRVLIDQKKGDAALERLTRAAEIDPNSTEVQRLLGRTYQAQGKTDEAIEAYRRAIELNELDAWSMNNLGLLFLEMKRADEALPLFEKAIEIKNDVPAFHNNLGMALEHTGRFEEAAVAYAGALNADPTYDKAKKNLDRVKLVKGNRESGE
jgi:tetratricopeptide (TPR) repeat protein